MEDIKLGDIVEKAIKIIAPRIAKKKCSSCEQRKQKMNEYLKRKTNN